MPTSMYFTPTVNAYINKAAMIMIDVATKTTVDRFPEIAFHSRREPLVELAALEESARCYVHAWLALNAPSAMLSTMRQRQEGD